ncbi:hypothetical protein B0H17DRAFT_1133255 [Mycena rosella]|uniref:Uncharacterized protein n=1 Tax=Mycena rosella TaxID=1033263 RepID=A0AAD7GJP1_MYCRO|nr:hypothetical protein B0H17DRAFT_1133255 [Mycena rosella]
MRGPRTFGQQWSIPLIFLPVALIFPASIAGPGKVPEEPDSVAVPTSRSTQTEDMWRYEIPPAQELHLPRSIKSVVGSARRVGGARGVEALWRRIQRPRADGTTLALGLE